MDFRGQTFTGKVTIDGNSYTECVFENAVLYYDGGPTAFRLCRFRDVYWDFGGVAANTINLLRHLNQCEGGADLIAMVLPLPIG